ncbi:coil containing protein [Vibrio phage 1.101.O._10N.261.45.C6]|nr:coil containing protein [Vibrio phage 1.101.O._10N.261.45.C6]
MTKNTKAKYLIEDVTFEHEKAHLAYTLGSGAASQMNDPYILKSDNTELSQEQQDILEDIFKTEEVVTESVDKFYPDEVSTDVDKSEDKDDALSVSDDNPNADTGENNKDTIVTDKVEMSKSELDELLKMKEMLASYQAKEEAEIKKGKEDIVKSATFIGDADTVVEILLKSEDSAVVEEIILKAVEAIEKAREEALTASAAKITELEKAVEDAKADVLKTKEDFAKGEAIEGGNHHDNDLKSDVEKSDALSKFIDDNQDLIKSL